VARLSTSPTPAMPHTTISGRQEEDFAGCTQAGPGTPAEPRIDSWTQRQRPPTLGGSRPSCRTTSAHTGPDNDDLRVFRRATQLPTTVGAGDTRTRPTRRSVLKSRTPLSRVTAVDARSRTGPRDTERRAERQHRITGRGSSRARQNGMSVSNARDASPPRRPLRLPVFGVDDADSCILRAGAGSASRSGTVRCPV
jgi:hypothetical protein